MEQVGLIDKIIKSAGQINTGRRLLDTDGFEREGRINYRKGLALAKDSFNEAQFSADSDLMTLILSELAFLTQELQFCDLSDTQTASSLKQAIQSFDDAILALQAVESDAYRIVDLAYPHHKNYRYKDMPKDSFHIACNAHRTRVGNILRSPGINMAEKALLMRRQSNLTTAQAVYLKKQNAALI